ncbi:hypothetical protein LOTGIDRAFT_141385 [Lottia gigantea]|uniref:AMP-dependent synthetase/ligase domain-containing protein n=1 Tax=Lottia gigantea TaxID=225164 RepID=V4AXV4_LOTGI|nr:hypothetical protein LOTGIDRAFT_141385 [Lottia gigantea]ESO99855.1 hypothetical protein LOTGIDRAFT_141385 [Lottia gigantea]
MTEHHQGWPLDRVLLTGQPVRKSVTALLGPFVQTIYNVYGTSEVCDVTYKEITEKVDYEEYNAGEPRLGATIRVVDKYGNPVPSGVCGHVIIKSNGVFEGYIADKETTNQSFNKDGYFLTQDYGYLNNAGELVTYGRIKDIIQRGENYYHPSWIESIIKECLGVLEAIVVKVPDQLLHHEICVCFVSDKDAEINEHTVENFCKKKFLKQNSVEDTAYPKYYINIRDIPLNNNGKYDRIAIEKFAANYLNLTA